MEMTVTLTAWMIDNAANNGCGYTRQQLQAVGIEWPPVKGWKRRLVGKSVPLSGYYTFCKIGKKKPGVDRPLEIVAHELALCVWSENGSRLKDFAAREKVAHDAVTKALQSLDEDMTEAEALVESDEWTEVN